MKTHRPTRLCPHCRQPVAINRKVCPNCGAAIETVWPPPLDGMTPPSAPPPRLLTGRRGGDIATGIAVGVVPPITAVSFLRGFTYAADLRGLAHAGEATLLLAFALAFVAVCLYFWAWRRYPVFARSLGWTILAWVLVPLGVVGACFISFARAVQHP